MALLLLLFVLAVCVCALYLHFFFFCAVSVHVVYYGNARGMHDDNSNNSEHKAPIFENIKSAYASVHCTIQSQTHTEQKCAGCKSSNNYHTHGDICNWFNSFFFLV